MINSPRVTNPLCCCEYIDKDGGRNHILACCCNCVELDKAVDSLCCCRSEGRPSCNRVLLEFMDRMRFPWVGGAKLITSDVLMPILLLPALFIFGTLNFPSTLVFLTIPALLVVQLRRGYFRLILTTRFFCSWTYTSLALIFLIYQFLVVPFLEISSQENWVVIATSVLSVGSLIKIQRAQNSHSNGGDIECLGSNLSMSKVNSTCNTCGCFTMPRMVHCSACQKCIPDREQHCLWLGCCIGSHNLFWFIFCLIFMTVNLLYSSNLILTTVCRPYQAFGSVLLPEDCSEVYYDFRFALCYVSGLYSLMMAVLATLALLRQCWLVSLGITGDEWRIMSLSHTLRLGITAPRPYSHGILKNWFYVLTRKNV